MNNTDELIQARPTRRGFLQAAGSVGLLGAALSLLSRAPPAIAAAAPPQDDAADKPAGYHETEHIRKYYAKLRQL
jgi:hypothetical protein